ncbi:TAXI family TRAP transporter solute-binding subunit [Amycolatopsis sp. NPDC059657]|uniref:TAXI family TRAP transporter solute-binding subunit n=1 Tax=Amycolatopsis sp. NPDC059657 TaxID=3346899 RepID=UPI003672F5A1
MTAPLTTTRRISLLALTLVLLAGCTPDLSGEHVTIAGGVDGGVYSKLAKSLAGVWGRSLGLAETPKVLTSKGSPDNLDKLASHEADVAFSAADVTTGRSGLQALARIYDDYLHVVVLRDSKITDIKQLNGRKVAVGSPDSGVAYIAKNLLEQLGITAERKPLNLDPALVELVAGSVDAVFWSGGLPTDAITRTNQTTPLRLLDMGVAMDAMRLKDPVYRTATIPASTYPLGTGPVTTLVVPNYLVVRKDMSVDLAEALVAGLFEAVGELGKVSAAAQSIDVHPGIETMPLELHPGALRYYRDRKP